MKHVTFRFCRGKSSAVPTPALAPALTLIGCDMAPEDSDNPAVPAVPIELAFEDGGTLIGVDTENLTVDKSEGETFTVTAAEGFSDWQWSLNGVDIPGTGSGTAQAITINAADYPAGSYLLGLAAKKDGVDYSTVVTFTVVE
ncbi:MAG: hypothetical protein LBD44_00635 [Spirochaetaceae bacterium]|jgi:hypothetical protein|nr:hypothetical protein [Spirochaetaceae bacterium]